MESDSKRITPADIEAKLRQLQGGLDRAKDSAKPAITSTTAVAGAAFVVIVFLLGYRFGKSKSAVIEVRRI
ncbi:MAG: hypothetical protein HKL82_04490 [Acidimicrobiaceae bacterium]|nr:hypothetical protein [Acidimicrobiaceae bacterium]